MHSNFVQMEVTTQDGANKKGLPGGWTKHAPAGGVTIGGQFFKGGTFIPNEDLDKMTPKEMEDLQHKLDMSAKYGPKEAKKILMQESQTQDAKKEEVVKHVQETGINENVYIIDDGKLEGERYGGLIIKKGNPLPEDLKILNALNSKRLDVVNPSSKTVSTYKSDTGTWPSDFSALSPEIQNIEQYDLLNNLSPGIKNYFLIGQTANLALLNLPKRNEIVNLPFKVDENNGFIKLEETNFPMENLSRIRRLSLRSNVWLAEKDGKKKIFRLCNCQDAKNQMFTNRIYKLNGANVPDLDEEPDGISEEYKEGSPCSLNGDMIPKFIKHFLIDVLMGHKDVMGEDNHHILNVNDTPVRTNFNVSLNKLGEIPEELSTFRIFEPYSKIYNKLSSSDIYNQYKDMKDKITPENIDKILEEVNYPESDRENLKDIILKRFYNISNSVNQENAVRKLSLLKRVARK